MAALDRVEGPHGLPALVEQEPGLGLRGGRGVGPAAVGPVDGGGEHGLEGLHAGAPQLVAVVGVDVGVEEVGQLHEVAVGIQDASRTGVGHGGPLALYCAVRSCTT